MRFPMKMHLSRCLLGRDNEWAWSWICFGDINWEGIGFGVWQVFAFERKFLHGYRRINELCIAEFVLSGHSTRY